MEEEEVGSIIELRKSEEAGHGTGIAVLPGTLYWCRAALVLQWYVAAPRSPLRQRRGSCRKRLQAAGALERWSYASESVEALKHPCSCSLP